MSYEEFGNEELAALIVALRDLNAKGLRKTDREERYVFQHISPQKLTAVLQILNRKSGLAAVLAGGDSEVSRG